MHVSLLLNELIFIYRFCSRLGTQLSPTFWDSSFVYSLKNPLLGSWGYFSPPRRNQVRRRKRIIINNNKCNNVWVCVCVCVLKLEMSQSTRSPYMNSKFVFVQVDNNISLISPYISWFSMVEMIKESECNEILLKQEKNMFVLVDEC